MNPISRNYAELELLVGRLCNEDLDERDRERLNGLLADDVEAQKWYIHYVDLHAALRSQMQACDDEAFALREAQAALDSSTRTGVAEPPTRMALPAGDLGPALTDAPSVVPMAAALRALGPRRWPTWAAATVLAVVGAGWFASSRRPDAAAPIDVARETPAVEIPLAKISGSVGARWAGDRIVLPEGQHLRQDERLELVEGLAEISFASGARVVLQGPAIIRIRDANSASAALGRIAAIVAEPAASSAAEPFVIETRIADFSAREAEFGVEIDVDGSLATQVYSGDLHLKLDRRAAGAGDVAVAGGQGLEVDATSGQVRPLSQPSDLQFVRYLPQHDTLVNLADVVAGGNGLGDGARRPYRQGVSLVDGRPVSKYSEPTQGDGKYRRAEGVEFIDGVAIPDGAKGPVQIDSIGRTFTGFPATSHDCWGGAIMARRPQFEETLPFMQLEFHGNNYGYVNWLHIASKPEELSPGGHGLIGMHSNCLITFDLHAIRARFPNKKVLRFRAVVGNLESRAEAYKADAWVIVDGDLRYQRKAFSREDGPATIEVPLADRDRFLVLAVTDAGDTAYDWVAFGDAVIEMTEINETSADAEFLRSTPQPPAESFEAGLNRLLPNGMDARDKLWPSAATTDAPPVRRTGLLRFSAMRNQDKGPYSNDMTPAGPAIVGLAAQFGRDDDGNHLDVRL